MKKILIGVVVLIVVVAGGWYAYSHYANSGANQTVATVNGEKITMSELTNAETQFAASQGTASTTPTQAQLAQYQTQALNSLIAEKLLSQAAAKAGITASSTEVDAQYSAAKSQFSSDTDFQKALTSHGLTETTLRQQIADNLAIQQYLSQTLNLSSLTATDAEIQTAYDNAVKGQTGAPPLAQVKDQVKQMVILQKQQQLISDQISKLKSEGNVQILIKTA